MKDFKDKTIEELKEYKNDIQDCIKKRNKDSYYEEFLILKQIDKRIVILTRKAKHEN